MIRNLPRTLLVSTMLALSGVVVQPQTPQNHTPTTASSRSAKAANLTTSPETVGLSSERLERISRAIQKSIDESRISGAVSLVARRGKIAYVKAFGMADREARKPMQTDNLFRICSMTKPITSVAAMILYDEGRFQECESAGSTLSTGQDVTAWQSCRRQASHHGPSPAHPYLRAHVSLE